MVAVQTDLDRFPCSMQNLDTIVPSSPISGAERCAYALCGAGDRVPSPVNRDGFRGTGRRRARCKTRCSLCVLSTLAIHWPQSAENKAGLTLGR